MPGEKPLRSTPHSTSLSSVSSTEAAPASGGLPAMQAAPDADAAPPEVAPPRALHSSTLGRRVRGLAGAFSGTLERLGAERVQRILLPFALLFGFCFFAYHVNKHYALKDWLFFRDAKSWLLVLYWLTGAMSAGYEVVRRLAVRWPLSERLVLACATGVYLHYVLMFLGGILGLYRFAAFAVLLPALMIASGGRSLGSDLRRALGHWQAARRLTPRHFSLVAAAVTAFGTMYLGLLYLNILTPDNASFDAIYYHLGIPQQNKALGGIYRTPEGWIVDGLPLLASVIYTWPFIFPGNNLFDSMMACAHMEYVLFAATLATLPVLVRWLVPRSRSWGAWASMFLFPAIMVYDAGLHSANDHIAAFWGVPIWLALRRSWVRLAPADMALFALAASGALMTKYPAFGLFLAP